MNVYFVYTYSCPISGIVRYVGMGKGRRCDNLHRRNPGARSWIAELAVAGEKPVKKIIASGLCRSDAYAEEISLIARYGRKCDGGQLFNVALGGPGSSGCRHSDAWRAKMSAAMTGRERTPEHAAKIAENIKILALASRGRPQSAELIAKRSAALRGRKFSQEHRDNLSAARRGKPAHNRGKPISVEQKAKISATKRAANQARAA